MRIARRLGEDGRRLVRAALPVLALAAAGAGFVRDAGAEDVPAARLRERFIEAGRAYDEGRIPEAVRLYEGLIAGGHTSPEVFFNLGNASFRDGRLGPAVLNYRKAWRLAPRDADIGANLRLALQAAGAPEVDLSGPEIVFTRLSEREWTGVAAVSWWATFLSLSLALVLRARRRLPLSAAVAAGTVTVVALLGLRVWGGFDRNPEVVVLGAGERALSAPQVSATALFPLPEGSVVRASERRGEWLKVASGQLAGWIRREACAPVLPEAAPD